MAAPLLILQNHFRTCHTASLDLLNLREPGKCPADEGSKDPQQTGGTDRPRRPAQFTTEKRRYYYPTTRWDCGSRVGWDFIIALCTWQKYLTYMAYGIELNLTW